MANIEEALLLVENSFNCMTYKYVTISSVLHNGLKMRGCSRYLLALLKILQTIRIESIRRITSEVELPVLTVIQ